MDERSDRPLPSRREFLALGVGAFVVSTLPLGALRRRHLVRRTVPVMGTLAEFAVVHRDERYAQSAIGAALDELYRVERTMSRFRADSDVGRANLRAADEAVAIGEETALVLRHGLRWALLSDDAFDPALGRAVGLWDVEHRNAPPAETAVHRYAGQHFWRDVDLDTWRGAPAVRFSSPDAGLDLGGIAKGYAVDRAVARLREWGIGNALVNVGGDLYALGRNAEDEPWRIGIQSPFEPGALLGEFPLSDRAVATSGDYIRYFDWHGRRYHHLIDPGTGEPRRSAMHTITIAADDCMAADAAATAGFGAPAPATRRVLGAAGVGAEIVHSA